MMKLAVITVSLCVLGPAPALSDNALPLSCPQALEQLTTLNTGVPVYKFTAPDHRHFLDDADRPAEITRLQKVADASCSAYPKEKAEQEAEAARLHAALSPECATERDTLTAMEQAGSRESPQSIAEKRKLVAAHCPALDTTNLWLMQWEGVAVRPAPTHF